MQKMRILLGMFERRRIKQRNTRTNTRTHTQSEYQTNFLLQTRTKRLPFIVYNHFIYFRFVPNVENPIPIFNNKTKLRIQYWSVALLFHNHFSLLSSPIFVIVMPPFVPHTCTRPGKARLLFYFCFPFLKRKKKRAKIFRWPILSSNASISSIFNLFLFYLTSLSLFFGRVLLVTAKEMGIFHGNCKGGQPYTHTHTHNMPKPYCTHSGLGGVKYRT